MTNFFDIPKPPSPQCSPVNGDGIAVNKENRPYLLTTPQKFTTFAQQETQPQLIVP